MPIFTHKVCYDIFTGDEISVRGFLVMGKDNLENGGTIKPALLIRSTMKVYKTLVKEENAMSIYTTRTLCVSRL